MSISDFAEQNKAKAVTWNTEEKKSEQNKVPVTSQTVEPAVEEPTAKSHTTVSSTEIKEPAPQSQTQPAQTADDVLGGILDKIGDIGSNASFKMMIIGPPGQTKSSFIASAPNNLIYDFEDGLMSAKSSPNGIGEGTQSIPYTGMDDFRQLVGGFANKDSRLERFKVFSIDTLSDLHKRDLSEITERDWRRQPSRNRFVPETEQYTEVNERIMRVVRALRDLPIDILITSHSKTVEPKKGPSATYADFSESLSNKVMAMMDIVGYLQFKKIDKELVPVLRTKTDGVIRCKSRIELPDEIINPTYATIRKAWEESKNK